MVAEFSNGNSNHRCNNKYVIYEGYDFVNNEGNRYTPVTGSADDIVHICYSGAERNYLTTLHEISHTFGALDHYHNNSGKEGECTTGNRCSHCGTFEYKRSEFCVMTGGTYDADHPFCDECEAEIKAGIYFKRSANR